MTINQDNQIQSKGGSIDGQVTTLDVYNLYSVKWSESDLTPESFAHP